MQSPGLPFAQHGTDSNTYTHTLYEGETAPEDSVSTTLGSADAPVFTTRFTIPDSAGYSFDADDNEVTWEVETHVDIPNWPDWNHTEPLLVRPSSEKETVCSTEEDQEVAPDEMTW